MSITNGIKTKIRPIDPMMMRSFTILAWYRLIAFLRWCFDSVRVVSHGLY